jgi:branched-chain amino acid transport system permease protein
MEVGLNQSISRSVGRKWLGIVVLLFAFLIGGSTAFAATPTPSPTGDVATTFILGGKIADCGVGIPGIKISVSGPGVNVNLVTDKKGVWEVQTPTTTRYLKDKFTVTLDKTTLPKGRVLIGTSTRTVVFNMVNAASAAFKLVPIDCGSTSPNQPKAAENPIVVALFNGINFGLMLAMAAIGLSLIYGTTGLSNFAHGEMVSIGALSTWVFNRVLGLDLIPAALLAILIVTAFGYAQDALIWRPLRKKRIGLTQMMIVSIGLSMVVRYTLQMIFGGDTKVLTQGATWSILGISMPAVNVICSALSVVVLVAYSLFLTKTRIGKATRAVSDNPSLAASTGIDVESIIRIVWIIAAVLTGIAGVFIGLYEQAAWDTGFWNLLLIFAAVTLGGLGTSAGAAVGAMIIGMLVELSTLVIPPDLKVAAALVVMILVLLVKPEGVLGKKQRIG